MSTHRFLPLLLIGFSISVAWPPARADVLYSTREFVVSATQVRAFGPSDGGLVATATSEGRIVVRSADDRAQGVAGGGRLARGLLWLDSEYPLLDAVYRMAAGACMGPLPADATQASSMMLLSQVFCHPGEVGDRLDEMLRDTDAPAPHALTALLDYADLTGDVTRMEELSVTASVWADALRENTHVETLAGGAWRVRALSALAAMAARIGDAGGAAERDLAARSLREALRQRFWNDEAKAFVGLPGHRYSDVESVAAAVLSGVAIPADEAIERTCFARYGIPRQWPVSGDADAGAGDEALWAWAANRMRDGDGVWQVLMAQTRAIALSLGTPLGRDARTGASAIREQDARAASAFLGVLYRGVFGLTLDEDGLHLAPVLPARPSVQLRLNRLPYRRSTLDIVLTGYGSVIRSVRLDGRRLEQPVIPPSLVGAHVVTVVLGDPVSPPGGYDGAGRHDEVALPSGVVASDPVYSADGTLYARTVQDGTAVLRTLPHGEEAMSATRAIGARRCVSPTVREWYALDPAPCMATRDGDWVSLAGSLVLDATPRRMAVSANARAMAVVTDDGTLSIASRGAWAWRPAQRIDDPPEPVYDVAWSADGEVLLLLAGETPRVYTAWRLPTGISDFHPDERIPASLLRGARQLALSPDEATLALSDGERVWLARLPRTPHAGLRVSPFASLPRPALDLSIERVEALVPAVQGEPTAWTRVLADRPDIWVSDDLPEPAVMDRMLDRSPRLDTADSKLTATFYAAKFHLWNARMAEHLYPFETQGTGDGVAALDRTSVLAACLAPLDPAGAMRTLIAFLDAQAPDGALPARLDPDPVYTQEPFVEWLATACWELHTVTEDETFLAFAAEALSRWDRWLATRCDSNRNGLLERDGVESVAFNAAACERASRLGMMYDALGRGDLAQSWFQRAEYLRKHMRAVFYDPAAGWYYDRAVSGLAVLETRAEAFAVVAAYVATPGQAEAMLARLTDPAGFAAPSVPLPSRALAEIQTAALGHEASDAACVRSEHTWLVARGLERYGRYGEAARLRSEWVAAWARGGLAPLDAWAGYAIGPSNDPLTAAVYLHACMSLFGVLVSADGLTWNAFAMPEAAWTRWDAPWAGARYVLDNTLDGGAVLRSMVAAPLSLPSGFRYTTTRAMRPVAALNISDTTRALSEGAGVLAPNQRRAFTGMGNHE